MDKLYVDELPEIRKFAVDLSLLGSNETAVPEAERRLEATLEVPLRFGRGLLTADSDTTLALTEVKSKYHLGAKAPWRTRLSSGLLRCDGRDL